MFVESSALAPLISRNNRARIKIICYNRAMQFPWSIDVRDRQLRPEWMDRPGLEVGAHRAALWGLARVNALSFVHRTFWRPIRELAKCQSPGEVRVLDVACGGGDIAVRLAQLARRSRFRLTVDGCDIRPNALSLARERADRAQVSCRFFEFNALQQDWPNDYDVIVNSLFLHHLTNEDVVTVLTQMASATRRLVLANDLVRSPTGYLLARFGARLLSRSPIVHTDGPASVIGAFTRAELHDLARRAGLRKAKVKRCWPARMLLEWSKT
jgi:2-polyprenyl-3-methyl-5-hydroxy-6-metoxy-1,4-benzoquinol methylase